MFRKIDEFEIYQDPDFFAAFPAVANLGDGEFVVAFRRACRYRGLPGLKKGWFTHLDKHSRLMLCRTKDSGKTWSRPELLFAADNGGPQDGGLFYDGKVLFANSFIWGNVPDGVIEYLRANKLDEYIFSCGGSSIATHIGSFAMRSFDKGKSWEGPFFPDPIPDYPDALPNWKLRMHNRANIIRLKDGRLLYCGQALRYRPKYCSSIVLYESRDEGSSWQYLSTVAPDHGVGVLEEPFMIETDSGKLVMIIRTHKSVEGEEFTYTLSDGSKDKRAHLYRTESSDNGKTWSEAQDLNIHGEPAALAKMDDGRILLVYGYRRAPFGVRGRICNHDASDIAEAEEFIIRDDGGQSDGGYPWIAPMGNNTYMIVYYRNPPELDGSGGIFGTIAEIV